MLNVTKELTALARKLGYSGKTPDTVAKAINAITSVANEGGGSGGGCDCEPLVVNLIDVHDEYEDFQLRTDKTYREIFDAYDQGKNIIIKFDAVLDETIGLVNHYQFNLVSLAFVDITFEGNHGYHYDMQIYVDPTESFNAGMPAKGNVHLKNGNMPGDPTPPDDYLYSAFVK